MQVNTVDRYKKNWIDYLVWCLSVNLGSQASQFPAIKCLLLFWLEMAIDAISQKYGMRLPPKGIGDPPGFPIYQVKDKTKLLYVSAVAFKMSQWWQWPVMDTAFALSEQLKELEKLSQVDPRQDFTVEVVSAGSIYFQLSDLGVSTWLQYLMETLPQVRVAKAHTEGKRKSDCSSVSLFRVQYAHARCCSLLRLADRQGIIRLGEFGGDSANVEIPWIGEGGQLRLVHPAERGLIWHFFWLLDNLYGPLENQQQADWQKLAISLSQSFEEFYSHCRIWGEVKTQAPELAQARLGLMVVTKIWLRLLLEDFLGVVAPVEL